MSENTNQQSFRDIQKKYNEGPSASSRKRNLAIAGAVIVVLLIGFLIVLESNRGNVPATPAAVAQGVGTATATATETAVPTNNPTATNTPTVTPIPPTNTPTPIPATNTPSPTPTESISEAIAICICEPENAAFFSGPDADTGRIGVYTESGEALKILGRSENSSWLLVENDDGEVGWVTTRYFDVDVDVDDLEVVEEYRVTRTAVEALATPSNSQAPAVAYWNQTGKSDNDNGTWQATFLIKVPSGGTYDFQISDLSVNAKFLENTEDGFARYNVTVSGMSCSGPLVNHLQVFRNGAALTVLNEHTNESGALFVSVPENCQ